MFLLPHLINYRYLAEAVFDIHNSLRVIVFNCLFLHNRGTGVIQEPYRGNTGALSITYYNMSSSASNPNNTVTLCNFINNSALATVNYRLTSQVGHRGVLTGRGGAMGVFVKKNHFNITAYIHSFYFEHNTARSFGGSLYYTFCGHGSHFAEVNSCYFFSNSA